MYLYKVLWNICIYQGLYAWEIGTLNLFLQGILEHIYVKGAIYLPNRALNVYLLLALNTITCSSESNLEGARVDVSSVLSIYFYYIYITYIHLIFSLFFFHQFDGLSTNYVTTTIIKSDNLRSPIIYQLSIKINSVAGRQVGRLTSVLA